jgi:large subunit ribosomal protein L17
MRHRKKVRKLNRDHAHRKALLATQVKALIEHGKVDTTVARAKQSARLAERMVTLAKRDSVHARRRAYRVIQHGGLVDKLFEELAPRYQARPGGYTRVLKLGARQGDGAELARLMWVE